MLRYGLDNRYCKVDTYVHIFRSFINVIIKGAKWNLKEAVHNPGWDKYAHRGSFWGRTEALVTAHLSFPNLDLRQGKKTGSVHALNTLPSLTPLVTYNTFQ